MKHDFINSIPASLNRKIVVKRGWFTHPWMVGEGRCKDATFGLAFFCKHFGLASISSSPLYTSNLPQNNAVLKHRRFYILAMDFTTDIVFCEKRQELLSVSKSTPSLSGGGWRVTIAWYSAITSQPLPPPGANLSARMNYSL